MKILKQKRCIIGEGPIWNEFNNKLYFTNGFGNQICTYDLHTGKLSVHHVQTGVAAFAFSKEGRMLVSRPDGAFYQNLNDTVEPLYDIEKYQINFGNDAKVGPDGRFYVGTQSGKRMGVSDRIDGKLYRIDKNGEVNVLLDKMILSNGFDWSMDEDKLYHTDSDTGIIKEYSFDKEEGSVEFTGRTVDVPGVDGFTINQNNQLMVSCWGKGHIAVVDTKKMSVIDIIKIPANTPASCGFIGADMKTLAITTASWNEDIHLDENAGFTILIKMKVSGRKPYLFG